MKKLAIVVAFIVSMVLSAGWLRAAETTDVLVVYYSRDGHTRQAAEELRARFKADIEELIDTKKRTGPAGTTAAGKDALAGNLTKIGALKHDPDKYSVILIGTPSWFSNMTPAVRTFVTQHKTVLSRKKIGVFGTAHLTGIEACLNKLAEFIAPERAASIEKLPLRHKDLIAEDLKKKIDDFYISVMQRKDAPNG